MNMEPALNCASSNTTFRKHNELEHRFYLYFYFTLFYLTLPFTTSPLLSSPLFSSLPPLFSSLLSPLPPSLPKPSPLTARQRPKELQASRWCPFTGVTDP